jgi:hypothetical protein
VHVVRVRLRKWLRLPRISRGPLSDAIEVAGIGCLVGAAWWWLPIVGLVATGAALLFTGWVIDDEPAAEGGQADA